GCSSNCRLPGDDCLNPHDLNTRWSAADAVWYWSGTRLRLENEYVGTCGITTGPDGIASFTAPTAGSYEFTLFDFSQQGVLYVWEDGCGPTADEMVCRSTADADGTIRTTMTLAANQTVYIAVDGGTVGTAVHGFTLE